MKELLERLADMPQYLIAAIEAVGDGGVAMRGAQEGFSLREQACHLRDLEREGYLVRVRRILAEDTPDLAGFDGAAVAKERDYASQDARTAARDFATARAQLIDIVSKANAAQLARPATIFGNRITLAGLVAMIDEHDRGHREEIDSLAPMESR